MGSPNLNAVPNLYLTNSLILGRQNMHCLEFECGKYQGILCGILSIPHNIVMYLNNVM